MGFFIYDLSFLILFCLFLILFLYKKRKNLKREGILFLYRTKIGLRVIDYLGSKYKKTLKVMSYIIVLLGYFLMGAMIALLVHVVYIFTKPQFVQIIKVPPIVPLIPYLPSIFKLSWLPPFYFTYWIIAIAVVAIVHEGFHGVYAKLNKVKIKSTGFGFLGPFLAFFVEQGDKQMTKKKIFPQLSILGAGVFANVLVGIFFYLIMVLFLFSFYAPAGAVFNDYAYSAIPFSSLNNSKITNQTLNIGEINLTMINLDGKQYFVWQSFLYSNSSGDTLIKAYQNQPAINAKILEADSTQKAISEINGKMIKNIEDLKQEVSKYHPGERITLEIIDNGISKEYNITLGESYEEKGKAVIGIGFAVAEKQGVRGWISNFVDLSFVKDSSTYYAPRFSPDLLEFIRILLWWLILINFSVALVNMLPVGIFDGGRFFYLSILAITRSEKIAKWAFKISTLIIILIVFILMVLWFIGIR